MISFDIERDLYKKNIIMIGVDEAGRGSWAGPLVSTACCFDFTEYKSLHSEINDSKKLKSSKRREIILSLDNFVKYSSSIASVEEIDKYGLSYANSIAMKRCIFSLIEELSAEVIVGASLVFVKFKVAIAWPVSSELSDAFIEVALTVRVFVAGGSSDVLSYFTFLAIVWTISSETVGAIILSVTVTLSTKSWAPAQ